MKAATDVLVASVTCAGGMRHIRYDEAPVSLCGIEASWEDRDIPIPDYPQPLDSGWCLVCLKLAKLALFGWIHDDV